VRKIGVTQRRTLQFDYYENTAKAEAFTLLNQRGLTAGILATATRVSDQYFKIEPIAVEAGTYFLVTMTGEQVIYSMSVTDGINPEPIVGTFQFPEMSVNAALLSLMGISLR